MRNDVINILKNKGNTKDKVRYDELLKIYSNSAGFNQVYFYQLGYSPQKLENLIYDVKNHFHITEKDIIVFKEPETNLELLKDEELGHVVLSNLVKNELSPEQQKVEEIIDLLKLKDNIEVLDGLKFREEYPFLNNESTPMEIKALVADKISAYKKYAKTHSEILNAESDEDAVEKLYELAKSALEEHQINQQIKKELDFYRDSPGRIFGKHASLERLKIRQDVYDMQEVDLVKGRLNSQKNISRYEKEKKSEHVKKWKFRLEVIEKRLKEEFNYNFEEK
ncbi:Uncharacterised protein [Chryseobacterium nakagawai]|uniref:Uncharacterized protein n=1 Tax=Chryseobacterium nakagawai TaxID=1241982 RepID=A0AAD1DT05_CHRNA|nr:hypothetical protein [Chryseobacterium nakagawai]AZA93050.1 hypothetical protein EG343_21820 [Chryseobacterium nakagawai]VEH19683.1 Uncharacterised protein [Chryseobacterium nakagawai]